MSRAESAVLLVSDVHTGKQTQSFNVEILHERMNRMAENTFKVAKIIKKSYEIKKLYIFMLGDIVDGDEIYKTHSHHTDKQGMAAYGRQQVKRAVEIFKQPLEKLQKEFGQVEIHGVPGNHGRVSHYTHEANNWDLMFYDLLEIANPNTKVQCHEDFYAIVDVEGHGFFLNHGKGIRMYQNIPWYGATQRVMRWSGSLSKKFIAACFGHFHTFGSHKWLDTEIFFNGTAVTDDDFPLEVLGMDGVPRYWFLGVHEERGITWRYPIDLLR